MGYNIPGGGAQYSPQKSAPALLNPGPPPPRPVPQAPVVSARGNVGASQPHGTAKLAPAPSGGFLSGIGHALGHVGGAVVHATGAPPPWRPPPGARGDIQTSGPGYGSAEASLYKQSAGYRLAIVQTFLHQPDPQKSAILKGAVSNPSYEGNLILGVLHQRVPSDLFGPLLSKYGVDLGAKGLKDTGLGKESGISNLGKEASAVKNFLGTGQSPTGSLGWQQQQDKVGASALNSAAKGVGFLVTPRQTSLDMLTQKIGGPVQGDLGKVIVGAAQKGIAAIPTYTGDPSHVVQARFAPGGELPSVGQFGKNLASNAVGYVPNTIQATAGLIQQVAQGHYAQAGNMVLAPYKKFWHDPAGMAYHAPVDTAMLVGGIAGPFRGAGNLARRGAFGESAAAAASTARAPLELGPHTGIFEKRSWSPNPVVKGGQVLRGKAQLALSRDPQLAGKSFAGRTLGGDPNVARQSILPASIAHSLNIGLDAKLSRIANEMTAMHKVDSTAGRGRGVKAINGNRPQSGPATALVSFIQQRVVRTPGTAVADIGKEIARLEAVRPTLRAFDKVQNGRQISDLKAVASDPRAIAQAFKAAEGTSSWFNSRDEHLVEKGLIEPDQALRSKLFSYAQSHMGAKYDFKGGPTPEALAFRAAHATEQTAGKAVQDATAKLAQAQRTHDTVMARLGAERSPVRGASDLRAKPLPKAAAERVFKVQRDLAHAQDTLHAAKFEHVSARSTRVEMGVHANATSGPRLVGPDGKELTNQAIQDHLAGKHDPNAPKVPEPAYVGHYPGKTNSSNFWMAYRSARGSKHGVAKTGEAFRRGAYDHSYDALVAQAAKTEQVVVRSGLHDHIVNRLGIAKPQATWNPHDPSENGMFRAAEAQRFIHDYSHDHNGDPIPGRPELTALTVGAQRDLAALEKSGSQHPSEMHGLDGTELDRLSHATNDALHRGKTEGGPRNVIVVPKAAMDTFREQFAPTGKSGRRMGQFTQQFRRTVLPYSTHWMLQIASEAGIRGAIHGTFTPANVAMGHMLWNQLRNTPEGQRVLAEVANGTFFDAQHPMAKVNPEPGTLSTFAHTTPVVKHIIALHNGYADHIGHAMKTLETEARVSGLGKLAHAELLEHPIEGLTRSWQKSTNLQGQVVAQLASRLTTDPALVAKWGRSIDETFGQYNKYGPTVRSMVQTVAPFLPWYINAAKFCYYLLPFKHPVASSLLASARLTLAQDIKDGKAKPLSKFVADQIARFTPFGIIGPNPVDTVLTPFIPEFASADYIAHGLNTFGTGKLKGPHGSIPGGSMQALELAAYSVLSSILPGVRQIQVAREGGASAYGSSTIFNPQPKPGHHGSLSQVVNKLVNPIHGIQNSLNSNFGGTGGGSGGGVGTISPAGSGGGVGTIEPAGGVGGIQPGGGGGGVGTILPNG